MEQVAIILAAGQGSRLYPLTKACPKPLLSFGSQPLLIRMIQQLGAIGFKRIKVVVGYLAEQIRVALSKKSTSVEFIYNGDYAHDTNILSLHLAFNNTYDSALIIEGDVLFKDDCLPIIQTVCANNESVWFTYGLFQPYQVGGIVKGNTQGEIVDMRLVESFDIQYSDYFKNLGIVFIGPNEFPLFKSIVSEAVKHTLQTYYMTHWIAHMANLPARVINFPSHWAGSFNTIEELNYCQKLLFSKSMEG